MTKRSWTLAVAFVRSTNRPGVYDVLDRAMSSNSSQVFPSRTGAVSPRNLPGRALR